VLEQNLATCAYVRACTSVRACVCVCDRERERERGGGGVVNKDERICRRSSGRSGFFIQILNEKWPSVSTQF